MSDEQFPGFIDDEPKPPPRPAKPAAPPPAFDPFADAPAAPAAPAAKAPARPAARPPVTAPPPAFDPFAADAGAPAAPTDAGEADIRPGMAKDLWACPHCGTKNKPQRDSCRQCGKRPGDPVAVPWHQPLGVRVGLAAAALAVVALLGWLLVGGSIELVPADVDHIDRAPRMGGSPGPEGQLANGLTFVPQKRYAVCGRVLAASPAADGVTTVVLALGEDGRAEEVAATTTVEISSGGVTSTPERRMVVVNAVGNVPSFAPGTIVSLIGDLGSLQHVDPMPGDLVRIDEVR